MQHCLGTKRDNTPCTVTVEPPQTYCWWHDPTNAQQRKQAASKGGRRAGRGRPLGDLARIQARLEELAELVLDGQLDRADAAVAGQLLNYAVAAIRTGLQAREQEELIGRLEQLEEALQHQGGRRWGA